VFRDEMKNLLDADERARRLAGQSFLFWEFLDRMAWKPPALEGKAVVQLHCHHKAIVGEHAARAQLAALMRDCDVLDAGCCGMAGAFGFERAHFDVAQRCGERSLLPSIRDARPETLIVTDGFSCREQIRQNTGRTPLHPAELTRLALARATRPASTERRHAANDRKAMAPVTALAVAMAAGVALGRFSITRR
jgi:Fe-S oxidoreductase